MSLVKLGSLQLEHQKGRNITWQSIKTRNHEIHLPVISVRMIFRWNCDDIPHTWYVCHRPKKPNKTSQTSSRTVAQLLESTSSDGYKSSYGGKEELRQPFRLPLLGPLASRILVSVAVGFFRFPLGAPVLVLIPPLPLILVLFSLNFLFC